MMDTVEKLTIDCLTKIRHLQMGALRLLLLVNPIKLIND